MPAVAALDVALPGGRRLRTLRPDDAAAFAAHIAADVDRLSRHLSWPLGAQDEAGAARFIGRHAGTDEHAVVALGIWDDDGLVGGVIGLGHDAVNGEVELGVWVIARAAGTGAAAAACRVLIGRLRGELGVERIRWLAGTTNPSSRGLAERLGFQLEGTLRSDHVIAGERRDTWLLSLVGAEIDACVGG